MSVGKPFSRAYKNDICVWKRDYNFYNPCHSVLSLYVNVKTGDKSAYFTNTGFRVITDNLFDAVIKGNYTNMDYYMPPVQKESRALVVI